MVTKTPTSNAEITVFLDIAPDDIELPELHAWDLDANRLEKAVAVSSPVRRPQSLASRSKPAENIHQVVTVHSLHYVLTAVVAADNEAALQAANGVLATLGVRDDT